MSGPTAWMPIYVGDYLGDTQRLTTEQHGAYLLLLFDYWRNGPPPADDAVLAQITRLSRPAWKKMRSVVLGFFDERSGHLHHGRVDKEIAKAEENHERRTEKARKGAAARWSKQGNDDAPSNAPSIPQALLDECAPPPPYSVTNVTGDSADPIDPVKALFDAGIALLTGSGLPDKQARAMVGKWRQQSGDDEVRLAIAEAQVARVSDPLPWMVARLKAKPKAKDPTDPQSFLAFRRERRARQEEFARSQAGAGR